MTTTFRKNNDCNLKIILIEPCNFVDYPIGGQLSFAKNMILSFGEDLVLFGLTNEKKEVGKWKQVNINGIKYDYFPYLYLPKESKKPFIPLRLRNYLALLKYKWVIKKFGFKNILTQSPESIMAIKDINFLNICYYFAGTENPLSISRYKYARSFAFLYDLFFLPILSKINLLLAAADKNAINKLIIRSKGCLMKERVISFPTRVDTNIFKKINKNIVRKSLSLSDNQLVIVTTGRLAWYKGWKFMIDSFRLFQLGHPYSHFYFLGNGEDYDKIAIHISKLELDSSVHLVGFKDPTEMAKYLNAADLFIMGSYFEGWSTSLIEAIACGTPACVTNFDSAMEIIEEGITGYVSESHDEILFAKLMDKCLKIDRLSLPRQTEIDKYSVRNLKRDLLKLWPLVSDGKCN